MIKEVKRKILIGSLMFNLFKSKEEKRKDKAINVLSEVIGMCYTEEVLNDDMSEGYFEEAIIILSEKNAINDYIPVAGGKELSEMGIAGPNLMVLLAYRAIKESPNPQYLYKMNYMSCLREYPRIKGSIAACKEIIADDPRQLANFMFWLIKEKI